MPAGIAGVCAVTDDQTGLTGRVWTSVQYCHPAAECVKTVIALLADVDRYQTDSR